MAGIIENINVCTDGEVHNRPVTFNPNAQVHFENLDSNTKIGTLLLALLNKYLPDTKLSEYSMHLCHCSSKGKGKSAIDDTLDLDQTLKEGGFQSGDNSIYVRKVVAREQPSKQGLDLKEYANNDPSFDSDGGSKSPNSSESGSESEFEPEPESESESEPESESDYDDDDPSVSEEKLKKIEHFRARDEDDQILDGSLGGAAGADVGANPTGTPVFPKAFQSTFYARKYATPGTSHNVVASQLLDTFDSTLKSASEILTAPPGSWFVSKKSWDHLDDPEEVAEAYIRDVADPISNITGTSIDIQEPTVYLRPGIVEVEPHLGRIEQHAEDRRDLPSRRFAEEFVEDLQQAEGRWAGVAYIGTSGGGALQETTPATRLRDARSVASSLKEDKEISTVNLVTRIAQQHPDSASMTVVPLGRVGESKVYPREVVLRGSEGLLLQAKTGSVTNSEDPKPTPWKNSPDFWPPRSRRHLLLKSLPDEFHPLRQLIGDVERSDRSPQVTAFGYLQQARGNKNLNRLRTNIQELSGGVCQSSSLKLIYAESKLLKADSSLDLDGGKHYFFLQGGEDLKLIVRRLKAQIESSKAEGSFSFVNADADLVSLDLMSVDPSKHSALGGWIEVSITINSSTTTFSLVRGHVATQVTYWMEQCTEEASVESQAKAYKDFDAQVQSSFDLDDAGIIILSLMALFNLTFSEVSEIIGNDNHPLRQIFDLLFRAKKEVLEATPARFSSQLFSRQKMGNSVLETSNENAVRTRKDRKLSPTRTPNSDRFIFVKNVEFTAHGFRVDKTIQLPEVFVDQHLKKENGVYPDVVFGIELDKEKMEVIFKMIKDTGLSEEDLVNDKTLKWIGFENLSICSFFLNYTSGFPIVVASSLADANHRNSLAILPSLLPPLIHWFSHRNKRTGKPNAIIQVGKGAFDPRSGKLSFSTLPTSGESKRQSNVSGEKVKRNKKGKRKVKQGDWSLHIPRASWNKSWTKSNLPEQFQDQTSVLQVLIFSEVLNRSDLYMTISDPIPKVRKRRVVVKESEIGTWSSTAKLTSAQIKVLLAAKIYGSGVETFLENVMEEMDLPSILREDIELKDVLPQGLQDVDGKVLNEEGYTLLGKIMKDTHDHETRRTILSLVAEKTYVHVEETSQNTHVSSSGSSSGSESGPLPTSKNQD